MPKPVTIRGVNALVANFKALDEALQQEVLLANSTFAPEVEREAVARAPKRTGFMASQITTEFSERGYTFEVLIPIEPFSARGFAYYPKFVHDGTSRMPARPFMLEAWETRRVAYTSSIRGSYQRAVRRAL